MNVKFKRLSQQAVWPKLATPGSACFDLYAVGEHVIEPGGWTMIGTGMAFEFPPGYGLLLFSRSGHVKHRLRLANGVGVIDPDYRGEILVALANDGNDRFVIGHHVRICQAMPVPVQQLQFVEVDELGTTERGAGGFGSTGQT